MGKLFGTDGVRGVANVSLTCETAFSVGKSLGLYLSGKGYKKPAVLLGRDTRVSGCAFASALTAGLTAAGSDVLDCGVVTSGAVSYLTSFYAARAGVMVSASHNPSEYNGIKLFAADGCKFSDEDEGIIEEIISRKSKPAGRNFGKSYDFGDGLRNYCGYIAECADCRLDGVRITLDCAWGAAYGAAARVFEGLGAYVTALNALDRGEFINAECGAVYPEYIGKFSARTADACFAFDGDADRCIAAEDGAIFDGDRLLYVNAVALRAAGASARNAAVGTVMTNYGVEKSLNRSGISLIRARVGDKHVARVMREAKLPIGGEQSGHLIFRDCLKTGDGILTAVKTTCVLKRGGATLKELCAPIADYPQKLYNINLKGSLRRGGVSPLDDPRVAEAVAAAREKLRGRGALAVRESGTEPKIRIMVQGEDADEVDAAADGIRDAVLKAIG